MNPIITGSLLVASAQAGAYTLGNDIDFKLLHGIGMIFFTSVIMHFTTVNLNFSESGRNLIKYGPTPPPEFFLLINTLRSGNV